MRKSNFIKILITALTFCLLLGAIVGVTAAATEAGADSASELYLDGKVKSNVEYSSKTYLYYGVKKTDVLAEDVEGLKLKVEDTEGNLVFYSYPTEDGDYYVFVTQGVPAKELNTKEVVTVMSGDKAISSPITWSVQDYLFSRLYKDGYAEDTDSLERALYYDLLKYGAVAQELLNKDAVEKIGDIVYVSAPAAVASLGKFDEPTKVVLKHDNANTPAGSAFLGWEYAMYDDFGSVIKSGRAADNSSIVADGYVTFKPVYDERNVESFDDDSIDSTIFSSTGATSTTVADGKHAAVKGSASVNSIVTGVKVDGADMAVAEMKLNFVRTAGSDNAYIMVATSSGTTDASNGVYWCYLANKNGYVQVNTEYAYDGLTGCNSSGRNGYSVSKNSSAKWGQEFTLRVEYYEGAFGGRAATEAGNAEDYAHVKIYINDELIHTSATLYGKGFYQSAKDNGYYSGNVVAPVDAESIRYMHFQIGSSSCNGTLYTDDVWMKQMNKADNAEFEKLGDDAYTDDFDFSSILGEITTNSNSDYAWSNKLTIYADHGMLAKNKVYIEEDTVTGNKYLHFNKTSKDDRVNSTTGAVGSSSTMGIKSFVSYADANANTAKLTLKMKLDGMTGFASQITLHSNGSSVGASPIVLSIPNTDDGEWVNIEIIYKITEIDKETKAPIDYVAYVYANGEMTGEWTTHRGTMFNVSQLTEIRYYFNNNTIGDMYLDDISFQLLYIEGNDPTEVDTSAAE